MKIIDFFRSRIILFLIQILLLSLLIYSIDYNFNIIFDTGILKEREVIIQFLANYILFDTLSGIYFIYISWILVSLIPIFVYNNFKKAYSMNLMTFFVPNFFLYVFLWNYSPNYFDAKFLFHFLHTILLGFIIISFSIGLSLLLKKMMKLKIEAQIEDLHDIANQNRIICPNCGIEFNSIPRFCYNCNADLTIRTEDQDGKEN